MKILKFIPNTITSMNLLCGVIGVIFTVEGHIDYALPLMLAAAVFDFMDGFSARLLKAYSEIGKQLDSLSDMVSFGVLPAVMLFKTMKNGGYEILCFIPLIIAVFSALRLAKFNIDVRQGDSFIGLATPSSAMICGAITYYAFIKPESLIAEIVATAWFIPVLAIVLSALMVSELPMFAMKFGKGKKIDSITKMKRIAFLTIIAILSIVVIITMSNWSLIILLTFSIYVIMNIIFYFIPCMRQN